ncbi:MAG: hypothetical protein MZW92_19660 [Comamonadaceae bacterium]|nr:hypothetical protein [Comamonadaceae bacterium]
MPHRAALVSGTLFALGRRADVGPGLRRAAAAAATTRPALLSFGALPRLRPDRAAAGLARPRARCAQLTRADWIEALQARRWSATCSTTCSSAAAIQRAGGPLPTMIIGTLPVVIADHLEPARRTRATAACRGARLRALAGADRRRASRCVNQAELRAAARRRRRRPRPLRARRAAGRRRGGLLDLVPDPQRRLAARAPRPLSPRAWATAQGVATLPLAALGLRAASGPGAARRRRGVRRCRFGPHAGALRRPDVRDRPVRLVARHAVLERGQPAPADRRWPAS